MPRVNRLARAIEHPDAVVGCIMTLQEKIKFLGHAIIRCECPKYQEELVELRNQLSHLRSQYQEQRNQLRHLQVHGQESLGRYRSRITSLLEVNANRMVARFRQEDALRSEVLALREHVGELQSALFRRRHPIPSCRPFPWQVDVTSRPFVWNPNPSWVESYPHKDPGLNPSNTEYFARFPNPHVVHEPSEPFF